MKLIAKGREQAGWAKELRCTGIGNGDGGCGALLLVEEPDLFKTFQSFAGHRTEYVTFECCECGQHTDLPEFVKVPKHESLPHLVHWLAERKK